MIVTVSKIGIGTEDNPYRPDTTAAWWEVTEEYEKTFVIRIIEE